MAPYVIPFILYLGLTQIPAAYPEQYAWLYAAVVVVVGIVTVVLLYGPFAQIGKWQSHFDGTARELLRPHVRVLPGVIVGLGGIALWIGIFHLGWDQSIRNLLPSWLQPDSRPGFNPFTSIPNTAACWGFIFIRFVGLSLLVPIVEELFWRGFLARWLLPPEIDRNLDLAQDWRKQDLGRFTPFSFAAVTVMFTLAHPEWLAAAIYCTLLNLLLSWTRDLWNCVVAHGVSNLSLGIYILATESWQLW
jgi:CAAX prenyl protease-like protein